VALEAAHIKWFQAGGPDIEVNGVALCTMHHKLFDRGAYSLDDTMQIQVSERAHGTSGFLDWLMAFHGKSIRLPQRPAYYPRPRFIEWHVKEVFQGPSRYT
jgi:putative restriction endonuclease